MDIEQKIQNQLRRQKTEKIPVPEWQQTELNAEQSEIKNLEKEIKILEEMLYPEGTNVITIPRGMTEKDFNNLEIKYKNLIAQLKDKMGDNFI